MLIIIDTIIHHSYLPSRKGSSKHQRGLTEVVKYFLGKPLSKVMRLSNWRRRPLSYRQVEYASLDAIVLLKCIEKIQSSIDPSLDVSVSRTVMFMTSVW